MQKSFHLQKQMKKWKNIELIIFYLIKIVIIIFWSPTKMQIIDRAPTRAYSQLEFFTRKD